MQERPRHGKGVKGFCAAQKIRDTAANRALDTSHCIVGHLYSSEDDIGVFVRAVVFFVPILLVHTSMGNFVY